jgi:transposase-like protein
MSKREHRRFTAEQKLEILREADQPGVSVSEVCRRHGLVSGTVSMLGATCHIAGMGMAV